MGTRDPRVDSYIAKAAPFARPILGHLREIVHEGCPDVEETMKWSFPHFVRGGILCSMAAFKAHCAFGFWKGSLLFPDGAKKGEAMGQLGRIASLEDLPPRRELLRLVKAARRLDEEGATPPRKKAAPAKPAAVPDDLAASLRRNAKARATFQALAPSHRNDYVSWIVEAKREETRLRRVSQAVEWLAEGKSRNWKYEKR